MKRALTRIGVILKDEWEKAVLLVMLLVALGGLTGGLTKFSALFKKRPNPPAPKVRVDAAFGEGAFAFLDSSNGAEIAKDHVFVVRPPRYWRPPRPTQPKPKPIIIPNKITPVVKPKPKVKPKPVIKPVAPKPPPPPPIRHFLIYRGFYSREKGTQMAYVTEENIHGNSKLRSGVHFLKAGSEIGKYKVVSFDQDMVLLKDQSGRTVELFVGDRFQHAVTTNPSPAQLQKFGAGRKGGGAAPRRKKGGGTSKKGGVTMDDLKKLGITEDTLKKHGVNPDKVKRGEYSIKDMLKMRRELLGD